MNFLVVTHGPRALARALAALAIVIATVGPIAEGVASAAPPANPSGNPGDLLVVAQRVVDIEGAEPFALSPDGRRLAVWRRDARELCSYDASLLEPELCAALPACSIQTDTAAWSPDGTRLAFTENVLPYFDESDLWVFDVDAGTVVDLTDDGIAGSILRDEVGRERVTLDFAPAWSPDGRELAFARGEDEPGGDSRAAIYRIPAGGGPPREITVAADHELAVSAGLRWLADGTVLYSVSFPNEDDNDGVWAVPADGGEPRQLVRAAEAGLPDAVLAAVSAQGRLLLLVRLGAEQGPRLALAHPATGRVEPVMPTDAAAGQVLAAAFSPDGSRLLVGYGRGRIAVRDLEDGVEQPLVELPLPVGHPDYASGLAWAANDLVFGPSAGRTGVLLKLAQEGDGGGAEETAANFGFFALPGPHRPAGGGGTVTEVSVTLADGRWSVSSCWLETDEQRQRFDAIQREIAHAGIEPPGN